MDNNEINFLSRVSKALGRDKDNHPDHDVFTSRPEGEREALLKQSERTREERLELLDQLKAAAVPLNLNVHEAATKEDAGAIIARLARETDTEWGGDKHIAVHADPLIKALNLSDKLKDDAICVDVAALGEDEDERRGKERIRTLVGASYMGITGVEYCVADCAAVVLFTGPGHGRSVSLVPSVHVAVVLLDQLLADLPELYAHLEGRKLPASFNFISGPSKTADIEAQLVHGAHGPREMHLVVITG